MNSKLLRILHELVDVIEVFSSGVDRYYGVVRYLNPLTLFVASTSLSVAAAYSSSDVVRIAILGVCMVELFLVGSQRALIEVVKTYTFIIFLAVLLGLPSVYIYAEKYSVLESIARTVFISISSSTPIAVFSILVGVKGIGEILSIFSKTIGRAASIFSIMLLKISRLQMDILVMRFSRNITNSRRSLWRIAISSLGDTLLHSEHLSQSLSLAMKSRTLVVENTKNGYRLKLVDYILIAVFISIASISIVVLK